MTSASDYSWAGFDWATMSPAERGVAMFDAAALLESWAIADMGHQRDDTIKKLMLHRERPYADAGNVAHAAIEYHRQEIADATQRLADSEAAAALLGITPTPRKAIDS